ncbi:MAG: polysaccharide biosynthesis tyrosine autokinase [Candidatus Omnitrophica bacterium]|nr:polysaccharide biosynthesis tyrosine autokinase [Candidatus Omnitrophota bacterium]
MARRKGIIFLSAFSIIFITVIYTLNQPKVYEASATVKIERTNTAAGLLLESVMQWGPGDILATESQVIESWPVAERAAKTLNLIDPKDAPPQINEIISQIHGSISTRIVSDTNLIEIVVKYSSAKKAADIANAVAQAYLRENELSRSKRSREVREFIEQQLQLAEKKLKATEDSLIQFQQKEKATGIASQLESKLADLQARYAELTNKYTDRHPLVIETKGQIDSIEKQYAFLPAKEIEFARIKRELMTNEKSYETLKEKLEEARIAEAGSVGESTLVNPAVEPLNPIGTGASTNILLGIILGLIVGVMMGFVIEALDTSVGAIEDVEEVIGLPVLAVIPFIRQEEHTGKETWQEKLFKMTPFYKETKEDFVRKRLITHFEPDSIASEAFRTLRTSLKVSPENKVFLFTSTMHEEGKTSVTINTAIALAQSGLNTLLIGCDLRRPTIAKTFGLGKRQGLSEVLSGAVSADDSISNITHLMMGGMGWENVMKTPGLDHLSLIVGGKILSQPSELLGSSKMKDLLDVLKVKYEVIVLDTPPVLPVTDALLLCPYADSVVIVYQAGRIAKSSLIRAKSLLLSSGAKLRGVVLNHVRATTEQIERVYPYYKKYKYSAVEGT